MPLGLDLSGFGIGFDTGVAVFYWVAGTGAEPPPWRSPALSRRSPGVMGHSPDLVMGQSPDLPIRDHARRRSTSRFFIPAQLVAR